MTVTILQPHEEQEYSNYVARCPTASFEYTYEWIKIISNSFGFMPYVLISRGEQSEINGVLPLFKARSIFGTRLVSTPYAVQTPIIAQNNVAYINLLRSAVELTRSENVDYLEIRGEPLNFSQELPERDTDFIIKMVRHQTAFNFSLPLKNNPEEILKMLPKSSIRWGIKKAQNSSLVIRKGKSPQEVSEFYKLFLNTRKIRGVPGYPLFFFQDIVQHFNENCRIYLAVHQGKPVAAIFLIYHQKEVRYAFAGAVHDHSMMQLQPYHLLIWEAIKDASREGYTIFNFGGATQEANEGGLYEFKRKWSEQITPVVSSFYFHKNKKITCHNSLLFSFASSCWKHLPLWLIKRIDHYVIRQFV